MRLAGRLPDGASCPRAVLARSTRACGRGGPSRAIAVIGPVVLDTPRHAGVLGALLFLFLIGELA